MIDPNLASMKITKAEFICSNTKVDLCPQEQIPEYAFIGRSNVGKSSLINMLVERKKLAKTFETQGGNQEHRQNVKQQTLPVVSAE